MSDDVSRYYDENTSAFLRSGQGGAERVIHRAVWGEGVSHRAEAFHFVHELVLRELRAVGRPRPRVLDLGCGVGASLLYLLDRIDATGYGVTLSELQATLARRSGRGTWIHGDFCLDPLPEGIDLAYGIESFVHAADPGAFFTNVAASLRPSGRLVLVDDFLVRERASAPVRELARGWHAPSLLPPLEVDALAGRAGLALQNERDLTPLLELDRPRDWGLAVYVALLRLFGSSGPRFDSLSGGDALRKCLKRGLVTYRFRVYEKREVI